MGHPVSDDGDGLGHYYVLDTINRFRFYLPWDEGERLETLLDAQAEGFNPTERAQADPMFCTFTDLFGSTTSVRIANIEALYESTPANRAAVDAWDKRCKAARPYDDPA